MKRFSCPKGCCSAQVNPYDPDNSSETKTTKLRRKAGALLHDPSSNSILLIQSRGNLWGPPKGTFKSGEYPRKCASRELLEETGINLHIPPHTRHTNIKNKSTYFYLKHSICPVQVQEHPIDEKNDANGITWIKLPCLADAIRTGQIAVTHHCRILLFRLLGTILPKSSFVRSKTSKPT
jgi:ADP-ribose pyrophosphatase YjhB (NUDIX family)